MGITFDLISMSMPRSMLREAYLDDLGIRLFLCFNVDLKPTSMPMPMSITMSDPIIISLFDFDWIQFDAFVGFAPDYNSTSMALPMLVSFWMESYLI